MTPRVIAFANKKGGVGKTMTTYQLAGAFAAEGQRVLAIDLDPQANLTGQFLERDASPSVYHVLVEEVPLARAAHVTKFENISVIPSGGDHLTGAKYQLVNDPEAQGRIADAILEHAPLKGGERWDVILLDCVHDLELLTRIALAAAQQVVIPTTLEKWSAEGFAEFLGLIEKMRRTANPDLRATILVNAYNGRRGLERRFLDTLRATGLPVLDTIIKNAAEYPRSVDAGIPIILYKPKSEHAEAFRRLARELEQVHAVG